MKQRSQNSFETLHLIDSFLSVHFWNRSSHTKCDDYGSDFVSRKRSRFFFSFQSLINRFFSLSHKNYSISLLCFEKKVKHFFFLMRILFSLKGNVLEDNVSDSIEFCRFSFELMDFFLFLSQSDRREISVIAGETIVSNWYFGTVIIATTIKAISFSDNTFILNFDCHLINCNWYIDCLFASIFSSLSQSQPSDLQTKAPKWDRALRALRYPMQNYYYYYYWYI